MKKVFSLLLCLCLLFAMAACGQDDTPTQTQPKTEATTAPTEAPAETKATEATEATESTEATEDTKPVEPVKPELSDDWKDFTFKLDGVVYQIPCTLSCFTENGWTLEEGDDFVDELPAKSYKNLYMYNGEHYIAITLLNYSDSATAAQDCQVGVVNIFRNSKVAMELPGGAGLDSTPAEIIAALGEDGYIDYMDEENTLVRGIYYNTDSETEQYIWITYVQSTPEDGIYEIEIGNYDPYLS